MSDGRAMRTAMPRFQPPHLGHNLDLYDKLRGVAADAGCSTAQLCLAWVLSRGDHIVPIPGTTSLAHLDEDLAALHLDLPHDVLAAVDALFPPGAASGGRYNAQGQAQVGTETWPGELAQ